MQTHDAKDRGQEAEGFALRLVHACPQSGTSLPACVHDLQKCSEACLMPGCRDKQPTWSCGNCCKLATVNAHTGAALCNVELTDGRVAWGPLLEPLGAGVGNLAMHPSPTSQPISTWLFDRLSIVVGVDTGLKPVSCKHVSKVKHKFIDKMGELAWFTFCLA